MRTAWPGTITSPRAAPRRSRRCARRSSRPAGAPSRPRRRSRCPHPAPAATGTRLLNGRRRRGGLQLEQGECRHVLRRQRELSSARPAAPFGQVMRQGPVTRRDFVHRHAGSQRLCNDLTLYLVRPTPATRRPEPPPGHRTPSGAPCGPPRRSSPSEHDGHGSQLSRSRRRPGRRTAYPGPGAAPCPPSGPESPRRRPGRAVVGLLFAAAGHRHPAPAQSAVQQARLQIFPPARRLPG